MRPANLARPLPSWPTELVTPFRATPDEDAVALSRRLWDVDGWASKGRALLEALASSASARDRLTLSAAVVRHLLGDPALPEALLPRTWPSTPLRELYAGYQDELIATTRGS